MNFFKRIVILFFILNSIGHSQVVVQIPDSTVCKGADFSLPVKVSGIQHEDSLLAYQMILTFDSTLTKFKNVSNLGTMTECWSGPYFNVEKNKLYVADFTTNQDSTQLITSSRSLLNLIFRAVKDTNCITEIKFLKFYMFNLDGVIEIDSLLDSKLTIVHNFDPYFKKKITNATITEDHPFAIQLSEYVEDINNPLHTLNYTLENSSHFSLAFDSSNDQLLFTPEANWHGTEKIIFRVTDPWGLSAADTFTVEVLSVNDPPGSFQLLSPADGAVIPDSVDWITFTWQQSANVDSGDVIRYYLFLARDSLLSQTPSTTMISDTTLALTRDGIDGERYWGVKAIDSFDSSRWSTPKSFKISVLTGIENRKKTPERFILYQNYPNPFNPETTIKYQLPRSSKVKLEVWDVLGQAVRTLVDSNVEAGVHEIVWNGRDEMNRPLPSGIYFIRIKAGNFVQQRKIILLR